MMSTRRTVVSVALIAGLAFVGKPARADLSKTDKKCLTVVAKEAQKLAQTRQKELGKCYERAASPVGATCPDTTATSKIDKAKAKFDKKVAKKCGSDKFDPANLTYTGCPDIGTCNDTATTADAYLDCAECTTEALVDRMMEATLSGAHEEEACDCCASNPTQIRTTVGLSTSGSACGQVKRITCTNDTNFACSSDTDCDFGTCVTIIGGCAGNTAAECTTDADCVGTCSEITGTFPKNLECGGLYTGGGLTAVPLPLNLPDMAVALAKILTCDADTGNLTLGAVTQAESGSNRTCTEGRKCSTSGNACVLDSDCPAAEKCEDRCVFGAPLPVPNSNSVATSVCVTNVFQDDLTGSGSCDGDSSVQTNLRSVVYLNGDLLSSTLPPNVSGIQPCPLCNQVCQGGTQNTFPCDTDADCGGGTCGAVSKCRGGTNANTTCTTDGDCTGGKCVSTLCIGGPGNGNACIPETSGSSVLGASFPTSLDCALDPLQNITENIGGLPVSVSLTTGMVTMNAQSLPSSTRTFCGFCNDAKNGGTAKFEGDPIGPSCINCIEGEGVPCSSDADCADGDTFESCVQKDPGAFAFAPVTQITMTGTDAECIEGGEPQAARLVSIFCVPPTFDATVDNAGSLPGPGAVSLDVTVELVD